MLSLGGEESARFVEQPAVKALKFAFVNDENSVRFDLVGLARELRIQDNLVVDVALFVFHKCAPRFVQLAQ